MKEPGSPQSRQVGFFLEKENFFDLGSFLMQKGDDYVLKKVNIILEKNYLGEVQDFHYEMEDGDINDVNKSSWIEF